MNTSGNLVQFGSVTTTPIYNGFFNQGVALPASGSYINANTANVPGWTFTPGTNINLCNGSVSGVFTGVLPSTVTYYIDISQNVAQSTSLSQYVGIYQGTSGFVSFYAWPKDLSYNGTESISVSLGGITLLNQYTFTPYVLSATPYTAFNLPFSMVTAGTYLLTITVTNPTTQLSGINFGGVQIRSLSTVGIGYKHVDPSGLALYYPLDTETVSGTVVYDCSAGFSGLASTADASLCGGAVLDTYKNIMGSADVSLNGSTCYVQLGNWTCPGAQVGNGFSVGGWFHPTLIAEPSNATLCLFQNSGTNSVFSVFLNQQTMWMDFSYNFNGLAGQTEYVANSVTLSVNGWNYFTVTGSCNTTGFMNFNYYLNDVSLASLTGAWPTTATLFNSNSMGGVPPSTVVNVNSAGKLGYFQGYMEDFRAYNRALSQQDIFALWSYGFSTKSYSNLIDPLSLGMYYPMEQGSTLMKASPSPFTGFTPSAVSSTGFILTWTGASGVVTNYSYAVTPSGGSRSVVTPTGTPPSVTFSGLTAPSSAPYTWSVDVSASNVAGTTKGTTTVYAPPTALVLSSAYSAGNVTLTWTGGLAGTAVTYSYTITSGSATTTSGTGITSPYSAPVTVGGGPWTFVVTASNASGSVNASTTASAAPTITATPSTGGVAGDIKNATVTVNSISYNVFSFQPPSLAVSTTASYTINYSGGSSTIFVLAVGGGAGGSSWNGGGGGAGGVVIQPYTLSSGSNTFTVVVGGGGQGVSSSGGPNNNVGINGTNTTVSFTNPSTTITAYGGGRGGGLNSSATTYAAITGGSGGGSSNSVSFPPGSGNTSNNNYANSGYYTFASYGGGGGGAGLCAPYITSGVTGTTGGMGVQCPFPGISQFAPSSTQYGTYYWGGGGGGGGAGGTGVNGGAGGLGGGGGGGAQNSGGIGGAGGGSALNSGGTGTVDNNSGVGGSGGANTGGGGGGVQGASSNPGGNGGSGIVVIAFPASDVPPWIRFLIVAGGGGGCCGGGGGGACVYNPYIQFATGLTFSVTVGAGGTAGLGNGASGNQGGFGGNSQIVYNSTTYIATGGGGGGNNNGQEAFSAMNGGCGGGAQFGGSAIKGGASTQASYPGCISFGQIGGSCISGVGCSGGGGGAGGAGISTTSGTNGGNGGTGISINITGSNVYYGGGGGGGVYGVSANAYGTGGLGGGGNGNNNGYGANGTNGLGGGGGGGSQSATGQSNNQYGGSGGSGVVILQIPTANYIPANFTGASKSSTTSGVYTILTWTSGTGSYTT